MENLNKKISATLKALRQERGWSLDVASEKTGVSKAMLGQIEREESSPTIATLWKIISGFGVSFSTFVGVNESINSAKIQRDGHFKQVHPQDDKILIMPIFAFDKKLNFEMFIIELLPGCEHLSAAHPTGIVEHIVVVSGEIEVMLDGSWQKLKPKQAIRFNADQPHGYRNTANTKAVFHNMIHYLN